VRVLGGKLCGKKRRLCGNCVGLRNRVNKQIFNHRAKNKHPTWRSFWIKEKCNNCYLNLAIKYETKFLYCYNFSQSLYQQNHVVWHDQLSLFKTVIPGRNSALEYNVFDQNKLLYESPHIFVLCLICRANIFSLRFKTLHAWNCCKNHNTKTNANSIVCGLGIVHTYPEICENAIFFYEYGSRPHVSSIFSGCFWKFLKTLSRVEIFYPIRRMYVCGRSYPEIFKYGFIILLDPVFTANIMIQTRRTARLLHLAVAMVRKKWRLNWNYVHAHFRILSGKRTGH